MKVRPYCLLLARATFLLTLFSANQVNAQNTAEVGICSRYGEQDFCVALHQEFSQQTLLRTGGTPLDNPLGAGNAFVDRYKQRAFRDAVAAQLQSNAKQLAAEAMQTLSVNAANTQTGAGTTSGAATNLVTKPSTTDFLSIAAESGAFTDTANGTSVTLQANALGLTKFLSADHPMFERWNSVAADRIQPLNFGVTLNVTQTASSTLPTTGPANASTPASIASIILPANNTSFQSFTSTYTLYRRYNPQNPQFVTKWNQALTNQKAAVDAASATLAAAVNQFATPTLLTKLSTDTQFAAEYAKWHAEALAAETGTTAGFEKLVAAHATYEDAFYAYFASGPNGPKNLLGVAQASAAFDQAIYNVVNEARGTLASISYIYSVTPQQPATHSGKVSFSYSFKGSPNSNTGKGSFFSGAQWTGNFAGEVYADLPSTAKYDRLKDVQLSTEVDKPFGGTIATPRGSLSVAGYGQYQGSPSVLNISSEIWLLERISLFRPMLRCFLALQVG